MKSNTAFSTSKRSGKVYDVFKVLLKTLPLLLIFCGGFFLSHNAHAQSQYTHDFSTPAALSGYSASWPWNTTATISVGGVEYELTQSGNGSWENRGNGGANNSASLYYSTASTTQVTIKRKDNQNFKFYGLWMSYDCFGGSYTPPHLTVTYTGSSLPQDKFNERNQQGLALSKNVEVSSVTLFFSGLHTLNLDDLVVGNIGAPLSSNANLSNLTLSQGSLSPAFQAGTTAYTASVANTVTSVSVTPVKADANATVSVNGTELTSGVTSIPVNLYVGANTITVLVRAQDGTTKSYTVTVTRAAAPPVAPSTPDLASASDTGQSNSDNITNDNTPTFTGTATPNTTINLYAGYTLVGTSTADGAGNWSVTSSTLPDGARTITARAEDGAGNQSPASAFLDVRIDTTAPNTTIIASPAALTNATSGTFNLTSSEAGNNFQVSVDGSPFTSAATPLTLTGLSEGTHTLQVQAVDMAGNVDPTPASYTWTVDLTAPVVTSITRHNPATATTNASTVTYQVSFRESVMGVSTDDFSLVSTATASGTIAGVSGSGERYEVTVSGISGAGTLRLDLKSGSGIKDAVGNVLTYAYTSGQVYTLAPPLTASITSLSHVSCNGGANGQATVTAAGGLAPYTYSWGTGGGTSPTATMLAAGNYTVTVRDALGNTATAVAKIMQPSALRTSTSQINVSQYGGADGQAAVSPAGGVAPYAYSWSPYGGTAAIATGLRAGVYMVVVTDANGCTASRTITITQPANTAPVAVNDNYSVNRGQTLTVPAPGLLGNDTDAEGATLTVTMVSGPTHGTLTLNANGSFTYTHNGSASSSDSFTYKASDGAALSNTATVIISVLTPSTTVASITLLDRNPTNASSLRYAVTFAEPVTGVDAADFSLTTTGTVARTIGSVTGSGTSYTVQVNDVRGDGTLRLDFTSLAGVTPNVRAAYTSGQAYIIDTTAPIASFSSVPSVLTNSNSTYFGFASSEPGDTYQVSMDGSAFTSATSPHNLRDISEGTHTFQVRATDLAGNVSQPVSHTWTVDLTAPVVTSITRFNPTEATTSATTLIYLVTFSERVAGINAEDFALTQTGTATGTIERVIWRDNRVFEVVVNNVSGSGTLRLDVKASGTGITDLANNGITSGYTSGQSYTINTTPPAITSVSVPADGTYREAQQLDFTLNFSKAVIVNTPGGTPAIGLTIGTSSRQAYYLGGSGTSALSFRYTVQSGDLDTDGITLSAAIALNGGTITDAFGNTAVLTLNGVSSTANVWVDAVAPTLQTVTIASSNSDVTKAKADDIVTLRLEASEPIATPTVTIAGHTATVTATAANTYIATYTLTATDAEGTVPFTINYQDLAGNAGTAVSGTTNGSSVIFDRTSPTGTLAINGGATHTASPGVALSLTATDALTGVASMRFSNDNIAWSAWQSFATSKTWTLPAGNGNRKVYAQLRDGAGNIRLVESQIILDNVPLTLTLSSGVGAATNTSFEVTFTFSKAVTGFSLADLIVTNATASNLMTADNKVYKATITPSSEGEVKVSVAAGAAIDVAGNGNTASNTISTLYDNTGPTLVVATTAPNPTNAPFDVSFTFAEEVSGFDLADIIVANGTASNLTVTDGRRYSALITPAASGEVAVSVAAEKAQDAAGNNNTASNILKVRYDAERPTVVLSTNATDPTNAPFTLTIRFSKEVTGFTVEDLEVSNGLASAFTSVSAQEYTALITPQANGAVIINMLEDVAWDRTGNGNKAASALWLFFDQTRPTVALASPAPATVNGAFDLTIKFSEPVIGFAETGIALVNGTTSRLVAMSADEYTARITPLADGEVKLQISNNAALDSAGNQNLASAELTRRYDSARPQVTVASIVTSPVNAAFTAQFTFTEAVAGFDLTDVTVTNGAASDFVKVSATAYTALITPASNGEVTVAVAAGKARDEAGNDNQASNVLKLNFDTDKPTLLLASSAPAAVNAPFSVTFTFSKEVSGFEIGDIAITNGAAADFAVVNPKTYTVRVIPAAEGEVQVSVAADKALDAAGNGSGASNMLTRRYDTLRPAVVLSTGAPDPVNSAFSINIEFSEDVAGFAATGIAVTNGTLTRFSQVDGRRYSALVTPAATGEVAAQVPANAATDEASNGNLPSNTLTRVYDAVRPAVVLATAAPDPLNRSFQVSITFTEPVTDFAAQDITVSNATLSGLTTADNKLYTIEVSPAADGLVTLSVPAGVAQDAASNDNTASEKLTRTFNATRPALALSTNATNPTNAAFEVTFTFSTAVSGFEVSDIAVNNGAASAFTQVSAQVYTARVTPGAVGEVIINVNENVARDAAGNGNTAPTTLKLNIDKTQPTVVLTSGAPERLNAAFEVTVVFSEAVTGFTAADVTVVNGTVTGFSVESDKEYTLQIMPQTNGEVRVSLAAGVAQDAAGNLNLASEQLIRFYNNTRPAVEVATAVTSPVNAAFTARFTFSGAVESFELTNITVENGSVSNLTKESATVYTALVTPSSNGVVTVAVAENQTQDAFGNGNLPSNRLQVSYDVSQPVLVLSTTAADVVKTPFEVTFSFSKSVTGFELGDITVTNGLASALKAVSSSVYTALVTPLADGEVGIAVAADVARDAAGNGNKEAVALTRVYDDTRPTLVLSTEAKSPINAAFEVVFTFSEPVSGFSLEDISVEGGTIAVLSPSGTSKVYTATITPTTEGEVAVEVAEDVAQDRAGNGNLASDVLRLQYDKSRPAVTLATTAPALTNAAIPLTIEFSEPVTGFALADIRVTNGAATDLTKVSETRYSALVTPTVDGAVSIAVAENKVADAAANSNTASNLLSLTYDGTAPAGYVVAWSAARVDVSNLEAIALLLSGAEPGTTYTYHITSGQESTGVSGTGEVTEESFDIANLDLEELQDGTLTVRLYLTDRAGNKGGEVTAQVIKITRNIASVTAPDMIEVPIRTTFAQVPLPATVGVSYSNGETAQVKVRWEAGAYNGLVAGPYVLTGILELEEMTTNLENLTAKVTVEVQPNKVPTALAFSATTFKPEATADKVIGTLSTTDPDDTEFVYTLASGEGDTHNAIFEIRGDQVYLKSNKGLSGMTTFTIRVRSTDPYANTIERAFTLTKEAYDRTVDQLKIVNAFSPNGDGINDNWTIPELRFYNEVYIQVFDRSGVRVFETNDPEKGWDGLGPNGQILKGGYLFTVEVKDINWVKRGVVTILGK
ncbi:Ig-like domain-containing protein [Pontibacter sp. HSC-36F09]|uniref:Ig-like domain-containing protein n=1 Tax=Pontibacter sp. HSC-36F09 TaxID=2910966 RepID=UPI00209D5053|nr:Ig-like domain-containing protein [Pontibacter sp. HSC-36F09]MCP2043814.1 gliding motility-associated-like protein [Pontibacter sp. HSC-36F09]